MRKRITLKEVAEETNLSIGTVSMALNGNPLVNEKTRKKVLETATSLGYVRNEIARNFRSQRTNTISVVIPHTGSHVFSHPYFNEFFIGVMEVVEKNNMILNISTSPIETDEESAYRKIIKNKSADGVIVASASLSDRNAFRLAKLGYPVVFIGDFSQNNMVSVGVDDFGGAWKATEHLIEVHGFSRIGHISGPLNHGPAKNRFEGMKGALAIRGLSFYDYDLFEGDFSREAGYQGMNHLLRLEEPPQALFIANDLMSVGALQAIAEAGLIVPRDFAIVSFDDVSLAQLTSPPLTTVRQPIKELGSIATQMLIARINEDSYPKHGKLEDSAHKLATSLTVRQSCGCS